MASLNRVLLIGNLTRNPEIRYTPSGSAVCEFGLAVNRRFVQANGQEKDETCFIDIVVWGKQAESASRYIQKGSSVFVEGRLVYDQWEEKETQKKRSRLRVNAERVQFLDRRDDSRSQPPQGGDFPDSQQSQPGGYQQYNRSYRQAPPQRDMPPQGGATQYRNAPPDDTRRAEQQEQAPQQPPYETVEGVDDDIPF